MLTSKEVSAYLKHLDESVTGTKDAVIHALFKHLLDIIEQQADKIHRLETRYIDDDDED